MTWREGVLLFLMLQAPLGMLAGWFISQQDGDEE
jgi:hypothetical protein